MAMSNQKKSDQLSQAKVSLESSKNRLEKIQAEIQQIESQLNHQTKSPLVSICIPTYNGAEFLAEALASCLAQTYPAIEIIISDDDSTDETLEIAKKFQSKTSVEFRVIGHSRYGLAQNWNFCIFQAQGKYIKFLHQDDLLEPTCIEKMIALAEIDDEIGMVSSARGVLLSQELLDNPLLFGCQKSAKDTYKFWSNPLKPIQLGVELLADPNLLDEPMNKIGEPTTVLIRRTVFDEVGLFDSDLCQLVDVEMWLRIMSKYKVGFINEMLSHWRVHPKQKTIINAEENVYYKDSLVFYKKLSESTYLPSDLKQQSLTKYLELNNNQTEKNSVLLESNYSEKLPTIIISVVVSTYNSEKFIHGCLESLVNQTLYEKGGLEIIVINSGSQQNEEVVVKKFVSQYPNIKYIKTERETLYKAWNRGIQQSSGKYVINANTDDRFSQDALERMLMEMESHPEISAVYGHWMVTQTENDNFDSNTKKFVFDYPDFFPPLFFYYQITSHAALIRRSVFESVGYYDEQLKIFGDREFMLRFASAGLIAKLMPHVVGLYYENPESLSLGNTGKDVGKKEFSLLREQYLVPSNLVKLFGKIPSDIETNLASLYTTIGSLGKDFYIWDNQPVSDLDFAEKTLHMALEIDHKNLIALNNLAILHCDKGEYLKAEGMFEKALQKNYSEFTKEVKRNLVICQGVSNDINDYIWIKPSYTSSVYYRSQVIQVEKVAEQPLVSIIIPTKDRPQMLEIAVQSVFEQNYKNIEIIVVNDGGVDVQELLNRLNYRGNIFYLKHDYPKERSATRNAGIRIAKGKYIGYLDDDDLYYPDHIQTLVEFLENSEYKVAYTDATKADQEKQDGKYVTINRSVSYSYDFDPDLLMVNNYIPILCIMHERGCLEQTGLFDETLDTHEDWDLWIRMCLKFGSFYHIKQTTCEFTWRTDGSTTTSRKWDDFERTREIVRNRYSSYINVSSVVQRIAEQPLVTVIIPTKDRPEMLAQAIQSVLDQTFTELEIIVVNDGGVDVQSVISRLNTRGNIVYKKHDRAPERSAARNTGIRAARGKYIAYLDDDDNYYPNHIETLVKFLENSEYKIAYTDAVMAQQEKQNGEYVTINRSVPHSLDFDKDKILVSNCTPNLCLMHEKSCLDEVGLFDETLSTHEDWDLIIRLSRKFDIAHIKETTCEFTQRNDGTNTSSDNRADFTRTREIIFNRYRQYAEANPTILDAQKGAFIAEAKELAQEVQNLQSQIVQKESELQQNQAEKSQLSVQVETLQRSTQEVHAKLDATQSEKEWVKSQLNSWKQTAEEMQLELDRSRLKLKQAQSQLDRSALNLIK